jgi:hypothetical protein
MAAVVVSMQVSCLFDAPSIAASSDLFPGYRYGVARSCCACLAKSRAAGASCALAAVDETGVPIEQPAPIGGVPCLCPADGSDGGSAPASPTDEQVQTELDRCMATMVPAEGERGPDLVVPGVCIENGDTIAPCEEQCGGLLSFRPPVSG